MGVDNAADVVPHSVDRPMHFQLGGGGKDAGDLISLPVKDTDFFRG